MKTNGITNVSKNISRWLLLIILLLAGLIVMGAFLTFPAAAQCSTPKSSCISCHGQGSHTAGMGGWDSVHVNQDICTYCHSGNGSSMDKSLAHEGLVAQPLTDIYTSCHTCHPADYVAKSSQLAATLEVSPGSCATPTVVNSAVIPGGTTPQGLVPISASKSVIFSGANILEITMGLAALAFFVFALGWLIKHPALKP